MKVKRFWNKYNLIKVKSRYDKMIYELIYKYREIHSNYKTNNEFIYKTKELRPILIYLEEG